MSTTFPSSSRKSITLTEQDQRDLELLRHTASIRDSLDGGPTEHASEAALIRAVFSVGLEKVRSEIDSLGYEQLARDTEVASHRNVLRERTRRTMGN